MMGKKIVSFQLSHVEETTLTSEPTPSISHKATQWVGASTAGQLS